MVRSDHQPGWSRLSRLKQAEAEANTAFFADRFSVAIDGVPGVVLCCDSD